MKMATIAGKNCAIAAHRSHCSLNRLRPDQSVKDGAVSVTYAIFINRSKPLHLDIRAREGVNHNAQGASLATVVRIYQLKERKAFDASDYPSLFADDSRAIPNDWLAQKISVYARGIRGGGYTAGDGGAIRRVAGMFYRAGSGRGQLAVSVDPRRPRPRQAAYYRSRSQPADAATVKGN